MRKLPGQVLSLNQQLLAMTQQSHHYLQQIMALTSGVAIATTPPSGARGLSTLRGNAAATASPVFAGSGVTPGMFASPPATPVGVPGNVGAQAQPATPPVPLVTTVGQEGGGLTTSVINPSRGTMCDGALGHRPAQQ